MKLFLAAISLFVFPFALRAQKLDSIYFNLYTDSLKKGTYNYINVEGRYSDGRYLPMSSREVTFSATAGKFDGNSLFIDSSFRDEKVTVKVAAISDPRLKQEMDIYIKRFEPNERLPTADEVLRRTTTPPNKKRGRKK